ncbi:MAG: S24/S26 family peptidase [Actinobacteria bacterium]|nr:S24/S26 family peptidase [Actinomycetota bacterium]
MSGSNSDSESSPAAHRRGPAEPSLPLEDLAGLARDVIARGGIFRFQARGRSMMPLIRERDELLIVAAGPGGPSRGDILFTHTPDGAVKVHRLIRIDSSHGADAYVTKGDNAATADEPIDLKQIVGKVAGLNRSGSFRDFSRMDSRMASRLLGRLEQMTDGPELPPGAATAGARQGKGSLAGRGRRRLVYFLRGTIRFYFMHTGWNRPGS